MSQANTIVLRPRFKKEYSINYEVLLNAFEAQKQDQKDYVVTRIDQHVFIKFPKAKQTFWSPQLHLEIDEVTKESCLVHGLFGPNPNLWTLFMFLHFLIGTTFIVFGIWAYSNWSLKTDSTIQIFIMALMLLFWFALYAFGRIGKNTGKAEMQQLNAFMDGTIKRLLHK